MGFARAFCIGCAIVAYCIVAGGLDVAAAAAIAAVVGIVCWSFQSNLPPPPPHLTSDAIGEFLESKWLEITFGATEAEHADMRAKVVEAAPETDDDDAWSQEMRDAIRKADKHAAYRAMWNAVFIWIELAEKNGTLTNEEGTVRRTLLADSPVVQTPK